MLIFDQSDTFLDSSFFSKFGRRTDDVNQPVVLKAMDVWWMFNDKVGKKFLRKLS